MRLEVRLFAALRERAGRDSLVLEGLPEGLDLAGLKRELEVRHPELGSLAHVRGVLGTSYAAEEAALEGVRVVSLLPPVSGGEARLESGVFELCSEPLDPAADLGRVGDPGCGGTVVFVGTTRETNRGQAVVKLDYEAFEAMAGPEMERIFADCLARFGPASAEAPEAASERLLRMLVRHRTGVVGVGEASVLVAVASPHRDAAFAAARFLIDELKQRLPVWKKEVYEDGHHWIGDRS